jgi:hypothetical protein
LHAPIVEAQGGSALTVTLNWAHDLLVGSLANEAVVSDGLDVEVTSIGLKADLPKRGEVLESFADPEVTSFRSPLRNCTTGTRCCLAKPSNRATNSLLIGSISSLEAKRCPRWNPKKAATPPSR